MKLRAGEIGDVRAVCDGEESPEMPVSICRLGGKGCYNISPISEWSVDGFVGARILQRHRVFGSQTVEHSAGVRASGPLREAVVVRCWDFGVEW
jgi:hypothetical protein